MALDEADDAFDRDEGAFSLLGERLRMASTVTMARPPAVPRSRPDHGMDMLCEVSGTTTSYTTWLTVRSPWWTTAASMPTEAPSGHVTASVWVAVAPGEIGSRFTLPRTSPEEIRRSVSASVGAVPLFVTSTVRRTSPPATGSTGTVVGLSSRESSARVGDVAAFTSRGPPSCTQSIGVTRTATFSLSIHPRVVEPLNALPSSSKVVEEAHVHAP